MIPLWIVLAGFWVHRAPASTGMHRPSPAKGISGFDAQRGIDAFCRFFKDQAEFLPLTPAERSALLNPGDRSEAIFRHLGRILLVLYPDLAADGPGLGRFVAGALALSLREVPGREEGGRESPLGTVLRSAGFHSRQSTPQFRKFFRPLGRKVRGNWSLKALSVPEALRVVQGGGARVAVIDSGIDPTIKEIRGRILASVNLLSSRSGSDPGPFPFDWGGHGTAVTSVISQIAPRAELLIVKITDDETMRNSPITRWNAYLVAAGIRWAVRNGADIISLSAALPYDPEYSIRHAVEECRRKGTLLIAAAGNVKDPSKPRVAEFLPASYPGVVAVGGVWRRNGSLGIWPHSSRGPFTALVAPASGIWVESPSYLDKRQGARIAEGVSLAVPAVAAAAALVLSALDPDRREGLKERPGGMAAELERILMASASNEPLGLDTPNPLSGFGLIDCFKAVRIASGLDR
jgi:hypothetical protein